MFAPLYNARGVLTAPLRKDGYLLPVDAALRSLLDTLAGNYTYLRLSGEAGVEIVKVVAVDARGVFVSRGIDNTEALIFNAGDLVDYTLTKAEIEDRVGTVALSIYAQDAITIENDVVAYPMLAIYPVGATEIVGSGSALVIGRKEGAYGCCDGDNNPAPIQPSPFYLTSWAYPVNVLEELDGGAEFDRGSLLGASDLENIDSFAELISGILTVTVGYRTYDKAVEELDSSAELISGSLPVVVGYVTYSEWASDANSEKIDSSAELVSGILPVVTAYITHTPLPESIDSSAELISGSLV